MADKGDTKTEAAVLSVEEQKMKEKYGRLPKKNDLMQKRLNKAGERKYFDSGDYALCQAGKAPSRPIGQAVPTPESIPHSGEHKHSHLAANTGEDTEDDASADNDSEAGDKK
eukprot:Colp12_sorted_trinity150504_noHs@15825